MLFLWLCLLLSPLLLLVNLPLSRSQSFQRFAIFINLVKEPIFGFTYCLYHVLFFCFITLSSLYFLFSPLLWAYSVLQWMISN